MVAFGYNPVLRPSGGMADAVVSKTSVERRASSNLASGTIFVPMFWRTSALPTLRRAQTPRLPAPNPPHVPLARFVGFSREFGVSELFSLTSSGEPGREFLLELSHPLHTKEGHPRLGALLALCGAEAQDFTNYQRVIPPSRPIVCAVT